MTEKPSERAVEIAARAAFDRARRKHISAPWPYEQGPTWWNDGQAWRDGAREILTALIAAGYTQLKEDK